MYYTPCLNYADTVKNNNRIIPQVLCHGYPIERQTLTYDGVKFKVEEVERFVRLKSRSNKLEETVRVNAREIEK